MSFEVLLKNVIWADVNPLSCYDTDGGVQAEQDMFKLFSEVEMQQIVNAFVADLITNKLLAPDAVVIVLGDVPW